jgi:D-glycero-alpha-D-manno-heptose-7-phosphate kinase
MIITQSPLRISLGGGGTDLPSYYRPFEGFLISAAINKYVYITLHDTFQKEIILKYSKTERVNHINEIEHPIIREALKLLDIKSENFELSSMADIPAGTGLGSSSSFTCALLKALHTYNKTFIKPDELAEEACHIEIDVLGEPIGKQDQYISAFGGINCFTFCKNDRVVTKELKISDETLYNLEDNLLLFFTGFSRSASKVLKEQDDKSKENDSSMIENLHFVKDLGYKSKVAFERGDLEEFADLMNVHWEHKKKRSDAMSNETINKWYKLALENGALGGKLIGAGGGGFLMFYADNHKKLRHAMIHEGLSEVRFRFDFEGSKVVTSS